MTGQAYISGSMFGILDWALCIGYSGLNIVFGILRFSSLLELDFEIPDTGFSCLVFDI